MRHGHTRMRRRQCPSLSSRVRGPWDTVISKPNALVLRSVPQVFARCPVFSEVPLSRRISLRLDSLEMELARNYCNFFLAAFFTNRSRASYQGSDATETDQEKSHIDRMVTCGPHQRTEGGRNRHCDHYNSYCVCEYPASLHDPRMLLVLES